MADLFKEIVPPDQAKYLKPTDLGNVEASAGKSERMSKFANELPRLKSGILRIYVGRRGKLERWAIKKARMKDPIFALANGKDLALKTPEETLTDLHGPAADSSSASASDTKPGQ